MDTNEKDVIIFKKDENNLLPRAAEKEAVGDREGALSLYLELLNLDYNILDGCNLFKVRF